MSISSSATFKPLEALESSGATLAQLKASCHRCVASAPKIAIEALNSLCEMTVGTGVAGSDCGGEAFSTAGAVGAGVD